jgi:hypothetical protein
MSTEDTLTLTHYTQTPTPLPPLPSTDPLTKGQWNTILAFADTIVPCIRPAKAARKGIDIGLADNDYAVTVNKIERFTSTSGDLELATKYLSERPSESQEFKDNLYRLLANYVPADLKQQLTLGLTLLK